MAESFVGGGVAVITGGASGIGRAAARRAAQAGTIGQDNVRDAQ